MRYLLFIFVLFISCSKSESLNPKNPILGKWHYESDNSRTFIVDSINSQYAFITFLKPIDAPNKIPVSIRYDIHVKNDTLFLTALSIYPPCYFYGNKGAMAEYLNNPLQGKYVSIVKEL